MNTIAPSPLRRWPQTLRWGACLTLALGLHAAGAAALLGRWNHSPDMVANAPAILIDLAPVAVAPQTKPAELPPGQMESKQQIDHDPAPHNPTKVTEIEPTPESGKDRPVEKVELKSEPVPEPELATLPSTKPVKKLKEAKKNPRHHYASLASAPSTAERKAERAAAPMPGASARDSNALPNWTSQLVARLERYKRYPSEALSRGEHGVVRLAFSVDRNGGVHLARILRSSGSRLLDRETLSLVARAAPLPPPPAELPGAQIAIVVPIRYNIR
jgi:protein TonB